MSSDSRESPGAGGGSRSRRQPVRKSKAGDRAAASKKRPGPEPESARGTGDASREHSDTPLSAEVKSPSRRSGRGDKQSGRASAASGNESRARKPRLWKQLLSTVGGSSRQSREQPAPTEGDEEEALDELRLVMAEREAHREEVQRSRAAGAPVNPQVRKAAARTEARLARVRERLAAIRRARVAARSYTSPSMGEVRIELPPITVAKQREADRHSSSPPARSGRRSVEPPDDERTAKPVAATGGVNERDAAAHCQSMAIMFDGLKTTRVNLDGLTDTLTTIAGRVTEEFSSVHACTHEERAAVRVLNTRLQDARALGDSKTEKVRLIADMRCASGRHELDDAANASGDRAERLDAAEARLRHVVDALDAAERRRARHLAAGAVQSAGAAVRYLCHVDTEWLSHGAFALGLVLFYYAVLPALCRRLF